MAHRRERESHAGHSADEPTPYPGGADHETGIDSPTGRSDCGHPAVYNVDALDGRVAIEGGASGLLSAAAHFGGQVPCASVAVARGVHRAVDFLGEKGNLFAGLVGAEQVGLYAPRSPRADFSLQVLEAFRRPRDLKSTDAEPQRLAFRRIEALKEFNGLLGKDGHHLGEVDLKHETGGVSGRATRLEHGPFVHHYDVAPSQLRQMVRDARACDAGPDYYNSRMVLHAVCSRSPSRLNTIPSSRNRYLIV